VGVALLLGSAEHDEVPTSEALDGVSKLGKLVSFAFYLGQQSIIVYFLVQTSISATGQ